ncbi:MAG: helix-turn-helix domain-containing protein [Ruminococcaceae bacterium]|nr:helix-turn-helix domain-containing protein [Oscillospiraceae bacterium]
MVSYYTLTETDDNSLFIRSVRIFSVKKPLDSLLCSSDFENLTLSEQLRVMRLSAGLTVKQAADAVGIHRGTLMNYELGRTVPKPAIVRKLMELYESLDKFHKL